MAILRRSAVFVVALALVAVFKGWCLAPKGSSSLGLQWLIARCKFQDHRPTLVVHGGGDNQAASCGEAWVSLWRYTSSGR